MKFRVYERCLLILCSYVLLCFPLYSCVGKDNHNVAPKKYQPPAGPISSFGLSVGFDFAQGLFDIFDPEESPTVCLQQEINDLSKKIEAQ